MNNEEISIWVSDCVLMTYGTARSWLFRPDQRTGVCQKFGLPIVEVVAGGDITEQAYTDTEQGTMVYSGFLNGLDVQAAKQEMIAWLRRGAGEPKVNYNAATGILRQRY